MRGEVDLGAHRLRLGVVGQAEAEAAVDLELVGGVGFAQGVGEVAEFTAADPVPDDLRDALDRLHAINGPRELDESRVITWYGWYNGGHTMITPLW